jgi:hypothetical protein
MQALKGIYDDAVELGYEQLDQTTATVSKYTGGRLDLGATTNEGSLARTMKRLIDGAAWKKKF